MGGFASGPCAAYNLKNDRLIHIFGSSRDSPYRGLHYEYDPFSDKWYMISGKATPFPVWFSTLGVRSDGKVVLLGGDNGLTPQVAVVYDSGKNEWSYGSTPWPYDPDLNVSAMVYGTPRENPVFDDKLYIVSGQLPDDVRPGYYPRTTWIYDMMRDRFSRGPEIKEMPRDGTWGTFCGNDLYVFGGRFTNPRSGHPVPGCNLVDRLTLAS